LTRETILDAVRLAAGAVVGAGMPSFEIETPEDAELLALALEEVMSEGIQGTTDGDVLRFARKIGEPVERKSGKGGSSGQDGRVDSAARTAKAGEEGGPSARNRRKSA